MNYQNPLEAQPEMIVNLHQGSNEKVSVIIVHHNRPDHLNICLQSIHVLSNLNNYEVIVVDNNSDKLTQDFLDQLEKQDIKVIRLKENMYWSAAANIGAKAADPDSKYLIFLHDDTVILNQTWIDMLVNTAVGQESGMIGAEMAEYFFPSSNQKIKYPKEWCLLITRDCWNDIGPWEEELPLIGASFIFSLKCTAHGYKPRAITHRIVHHYHKPTINPNLFNKMAVEAMGKVTKMMVKILS